MDTTRNTFTKSERLCSTKAISSIFESGNIFYNTLFKIAWEKSAVLLPSPAQVTFSVPKKVFRHAVTRNLIKRRMREAYRKNKWTLYEQLMSENVQIVFVIILKVKFVPDYISIEKSVIELINKLSANIKKKAEIC